MTMRRLSTSGHEPRPSLSSASTSPRYDPPASLDLLMSHASPQAPSASSPANTSSPLTKRRGPKLTDSDRRAICEYYASNPTAKQDYIAAMYGVDRSTISKVLKLRDRFLPPDSTFTPNALTPSSSSPPAATPPTAPPASAAYSSVPLDHIERASLPSRPSSASSFSVQTGDSASPFPEASFRLSSSTFGGDDSTVTLVSANSGSAPHTSHQAKTPPQSSSQGLPVSTAANPVARHHRRSMTLSNASMQRRRSISAQLHHQETFPTSEFSTTHPRSRIRRLNPQTSHPEMSSSGFSPSSTAVAPIPDSSSGRSAPRPFPSGKSSAPPRQDTPFRSHSYAFPTPISENPKQHFASGPLSAKSSERSIDSIDSTLQQASASSGRQLSLSGSPPASQGSSHQREMNPSNLYDASLTDAPGKATIQKTSQRSVNTLAPPSPLPWMAQSSSSGTSSSSAAGPFFPSTPPSHRFRSRPSPKPSQYVSTSRLPLHQHSNSHVSSSSTAGTPISSSNPLSFHSPSNPTSYFNHTPATLYTPSSSDPISPLSAAKSTHRHSSSASEYNASYWPPPLGLGISSLGSDCAELSQDTTTEMSVPSRAVSNSGKMVYNSGSTSDYAQKESELASQHSSSSGPGFTGNVPISHKLHDALDTVLNILHQQPVHNEFVEPGDYETLMKLWQRTQAHTQGSISDGAGHPLRENSWTPEKSLPMRNPSPDEDEMEEFAFVASKLSSSKHNIHQHDTVEQQNIKGAGGFPNAQSIPMADSFPHPQSQSFAEFPRFEYESNNSGHVKMDVEP